MQAVRRDNQRRTRADNRRDGAGRGIDEPHHPGRGTRRDDGGAAAPG